MGADVCLRHRTWSVFFFFFRCHQAVSRNATDAQQNTRHTYIRGDEVLHFVPFSLSLFSLLLSLSLDLTRQHSGDFTQNEVRGHGGDLKGGGRQRVHTSRPARFHLPETVAAWSGWVEPVLPRTQPEHLGWFFVGREGGAKSSLRTGRKLLALPQSLYREAASRDVSPNRGVDAAVQVATVGVFGV